VIFGLISGPDYTAWAFSPILTNGTVLTPGVTAEGVSGNARFAMNCHEMPKHFEIQKSGASVVIPRRCNP